MRYAVRGVICTIFLLTAAVLTFIICDRDAKKNKGKKGNKKDSDSEDEKGSNNDSIIAQNYQDADRNGDQDSPPPGKCDYVIDKRQLHVI